MVIDTEIANELKAYLFKDGNPLPLKELQQTTLMYYHVKIYGGEFSKCKRGTAAAHDILKRYAKKYAQSV